VQLKDFRELAVWTKGYELTLDTYRLTSGFPSSELECLLALARDLGYLTAADHESLSNRLTPLRKMLNGFIQKMRSDRSSRTSTRRAATINRELPAANC